MVISGVKNFELERRLRSLPSKIETQIPTIVGLDTKVSISGDTMTGSIIFNPAGNVAYAYGASAKMFGLGAGGAELLHIGELSADLISINSSAVLFVRQAATVGAPAYVKGGLYFDTTLNKLRVGGAAAWETITSAV